MNKIFLIILLFHSIFGLSQVVPSSYESIDYLMTFSPGASTKWGDDDYTQTHFFVVPKNEQKPVYIRVFDPSTSGLHDTKNGGYDSKTSFTVYGGRGTFSVKATRMTNPIKGYDSGKVLATKTFANEAAYDGKWYTFGPFNPKEGEYSEEFKGYIFKVICKGLTGNDGNAYKYGLSYKKYEQLNVENGNAFTYEMSFKLLSKTKSDAHVYPFITSDITSIVLFNFDADNDIYIRLTSIARKLVSARVSLDGDWQKTLFKILEKEINTSLDVQIVKKTNTNNDMAVYVLNQYNVPMPLFSIPIGGKPKYQYKVNLKYKF